METLMKSRAGWAVIYILAVFIVLARIGNALNPGHRIEGILKLYPPLSGEQIGADVESLFEDLIVIVAIRHSLRKDSKSGEIENREADSDGNSK
jgi:hypothetical protein